MYLRRLELHGFKTFASRTTLDFERGISGIVGPNGSGKSNLADAIRWALGEQSLRQVRCRQAEDLIFAGTSGQGARANTRPPMGMAEVMLTFDNSAGWLPVDFHEVRIGRRLYRGGDNEYLLNGARVRLRDITDLLARVSVSAGGHLVIGQGLVDMVLNQRPEERRALVEMLAGLRFYYNRRDDAETKLRAAESNLHNVDAMIAEATPHLATLREQAAAYAQYHEIERELRDLLLRYHAYAHAQAIERQQQHATELAAVQEALATVRAATQQAETTLAALRERIQSLGQEAGLVRGQVRAAHDVREQTERELAVSRTRREAAQSRRHDVHQELPALEKQRADAARELVFADEGAREIEAEQVALRAARVPVERAVEAASVEVGAAEAALRGLAEKRRGLERQEAGIDAELAALEREEAAAREAAQRLDVDAQATAKGLREAEGSLTLARQALEAAMVVVEERRAADAQARLLAGESSDRARRAGEERRIAVRRHEELAARAAGLHAWLDAVSGGAQGSTTVASTLIAPAGLERALAAALGPMLSAQPVGPDATAGDARGVLQSGARAALTVARAALEPAQQDLVGQILLRGGMAEATIVGWADRLSRVDGSDMIRAVVGAALSTVLVMRDLDAAWRSHVLLAQSTQQGARLVVLVTPEGEALLPDGLLHRPGDEAATALERARELRVLEAEVQQAETERRRADEAASSIEEESRRRAAEADAAQRALRTAEVERNTRRSDVQAAERVLAQARREAEWAAERVRRGAGEKEARAERRLKEEARRGEILAALEGLERDEIPATKRQQRARVALQEATARRAEQGAAQAMIAERVATAMRRRRAAEEVLARIDAELQARRDSAERLDGELRALETGENATTARLGEATQKLRSLHERLRPLDAELDTLQGRALALDGELAVRRPEEARAAAEHEAAALTLQRADHEVTSIEAAVRSDLGLEPIDLPAPEPPAPGASARIKALRARLAAFGPVNARAPDDLATAAERQEFLQTQATDLRNGIARLRQVITEANATVRERFGATAGELDAQFRIYLQRLFGGGRGELTALYDESGLPSGLEITAQPPGKRTSELALLSGGERALVGLALVFAMLQVRPVPFCVLDEAEAALDEANTLRVGEILRSLSPRTQFIVITHNRGTMSHTDALYGVTMSESGVSQVAGLRLDEVEAVRRSRAG